MLSVSAKTTGMPRGISVEMKKFESFLIEILRLESDPERRCKVSDNLWQGGNDGLRQVLWSEAGAVGRGSRF